MTLDLDAIEQRRAWCEDVIARAGHPDPDVRPYADTLALARDFLALVAEVRRLREGLAECLGYCVEAADDAGPVREPDLLGRIEALRKLAGLTA
jgi:hypothetical protein